MSAQAGPYPFARLAPIVRHSVPLVVIFLVFAAADATEVVDDGGLFLLLSLTVLATAWFAGTVTAVAVTVCGAVLGASVGERIASAAVQLHLAVFVIQGLLLTALVAELRRAETRETGFPGASGGPGLLDPTLPLRLERARRETASAFEAFEHGPSWYDDVASSSLVGAGLTAVLRWLK